MDGEGKDPVTHTGREFGIEASVRVEAGKVAFGNPVNGREQTADQDLSVRLDRDGADEIAIHARAKPGIDFAARVDPGDTFFPHPVKGCEPAPYESLPVCLQAYTVNPRSRPPPPLGLGLKSSSILPSG